MLITRDTVKRKMDLVMAEGPIKEYSATFKDDGTLEALKLTATKSEDNFIYHVMVSDEEIMHILNKIRAEAQPCPF